MKPFLRVTKDALKGLTGALDVLKHRETLIGIPAGEDARNGDEIGNAAILAYNHFGSPANNLPARPVLAIGIKEARDDIAKETEKFLSALVTKGGISPEKYYERIGMVASASAKRVITEQIDIQSPAQSTLNAREARGFKGEKSLQVTGQLRNAITYVVRSK